MSVYIKGIRCAECKWFQCNTKQDRKLPRGVPEFEGAKCIRWGRETNPMNYCYYSEPIKEET